MNNNNNQEVGSLTNELELMRDRYLKLLDLHRQLQMQNSLSGERVLSVVETYSNENCRLEEELFDAKQQIKHLQETVKDLEIEKQRYKDDCNLAVRLLHRHPNEFISTTTPGNIQNRTESTSTTPSTPSQHSVLIPTFPPTFVTSIPMLNTTTTSLPVISQTTPVPTDNLRLAESLFKSNTVHRYPSTHFTCSNCYRSVKCCDVSVQTSVDDHGPTSRVRVVSLTSSDDGLTSDTTWVSLEPHHAHMTVQNYQMGNTRRPSHDAPLSPNSIPQMHHV